MKQEVIITKDGSTSLFVPELNETYHSKFGAISEAYHVFMKYGLWQIDKKEINILEVGFGTGLNALITFKEAKEKQLKINYTGIEAYPVSAENINQLNYCEQESLNGLHDIFLALHNCPWELKNSIGHFFNLQKLQTKLEDFYTNEKFDVVFFDAFGYHAQPHLWQKNIFEKMYALLHTDGLLTTYACRSSIIKDLKEIGFEVIKLPGAPGKREMLNAFKK
jgi:tRNA U34 5-methylaminomethyl-2-thiouridine-forming methyltransferase MnmC